MGVCNCSMFCCTLLYVHSSIAIILMGKRELIALLNLSSWCLVMVERLFLAVPRGCLQFVIVAFPDHTHLLFLNPQPICLKPSTLKMSHCSPLQYSREYSKTCLKRPLKKKTKMGFQADYRLPVLREHSAILSTFIKLPFVFKTFVLSIFVWLLKTGFTVNTFSNCCKSI